MIQISKASNEAVSHATGLLPSGAEHRLCVANQILSLSRWLEVGEPARLGQIHDFIDKAMDGR